MSWKTRWNGRGAADREYKDFRANTELPLAIASTPLIMGQSQDVGRWWKGKEVILAALEKRAAATNQAARQLRITRKTLLAKLSR